MTEAEREALELLNEERAKERVAPLDRLPETYAIAALIRAIEQHNALRADMAEIDRVAEAFGSFARAHTDADRLDMIATIAAKHRAEPDPLVEAWKTVWPKSPDPESSCNLLSAELAKRGIELARKENDDAR